MKRDRNRFLVARTASAIIEMGAMRVFLRKTLSLFLAGLLVLSVSPSFLSGSAHADEDDSVPTSSVTASASQTDLLIMEPERERAIIELVYLYETKDIRSEEALLAFLESQKVTRQEFASVHLTVVDDMYPDLRAEFARLQEILTKETQEPSDDGLPNQNVQSGSNAIDASSGKQPLQSEQESAVSMTSPGSPANEEYHSPYPAWSYSGTAVYSKPISEDLETATFIARYGERIRTLAHEHDVYASVMLAQAILESNSGMATLAQAPYNNFFNIDSYEDGTEVKILISETDELGHESLRVVPARSYESPQACFEDYIDLITNREAEVYAGVVKGKALDYVTACNWLQGRFSDDEGYAQKLVDIIDEYDLTRYDVPLDYELADAIKVPVKTDDGRDFVRDAETNEILFEQRELVDLVDEAFAHLGDPYVWGGTTPGSFDCSGLVQYVYREALAVDLPRTTYYQCLVGEDVDFDDLHMGDLVFFTNDKGECSHVGMYIGEGLYVEAPHAGDVVRISSLAQKKPDFAKRVLKTKDVDARLLVEEAEQAREEALKQRIFAKVATAFGF